MKYSWSLVLVIACFCPNLFAAYAPFDLIKETISLDQNFAKPVQGDSNDLMAKLFDLTKSGHKVLGYTEARHLIMGHIYLENHGNNYSVTDVYCQKEFTNNDFKKGSGLGPNLVPDNTVLNVEHTWPQSRFTGKFPTEMQKSDLHHLFPSDTELNSLRGNHKFAEVDQSKQAIKCPISSLGKVNNGIRFEPPKIHKGHVARSLFYFSVRYKIRIDSDEESFLRKWHVENPVDEVERQHHEIVAQTQGNRNPFIDDPSLTQQIQDF
jgi:endonuclease I